MQNLSTPLFVRTDYVTCALGVPAKVSPSEQALLAIAHRARLKF